LLGQLRWAQDVAHLMEVRLNMYIYNMLVSLREETTY